MKLILGCLFPLAIAQRRSFLKRSAISKLPSADILYLVDRIYGYRVESLFRGERLAALSRIRVLLGNGVVSCCDRTS